MADNVNQFINMVNFYNQLITIMSAVCVQKGGIAIENYVGRFFVADVLEFIIEYGKRLKGQNVPGIDLDATIAKFTAEYEKVKDLTTPSQKPIYEMTLEEFEKIMNI